MTESSSAQKPASQNPHTTQKHSAAQKQYLHLQKRQRFLIHFARIFLILAFLALCEFSAGTGLIDSFIFSSPSGIFSCFRNMVADKSIFGHIGATLYVTAASFGLVIVTSILFAILFWLCPRISEILEPYLVILNSLPKSALAPLLIVWLGANQRTIIIAGMSVAIFGSILSLYNTFIQMDPGKIKLIYTLHGTRRHVLTKVILPGSVPSIISNMKINIGLCLVGVVIGEFLAARKGLGYLIIYSSQVFKMDWLLMSIVLLCIMAILLYAFVNLLEKGYQKGCR